MFSRPFEWISSFLSHIHIDCVLSKSTHKHFTICGKWPTFRVREDSGIVSSSFYSLTLAEGQQSTLFILVR